MGRKKKQNKHGVFNLQQPANFVITKKDQLIKKQNYKDDF